VRKIGDTAWTECTDFTTNRQATENARHILLANDSSLKYVAQPVTSERIRNLETILVPLNGQPRTGVNEEKDVFVAQEKGDVQQQQQEGCCIQ
jgi:hypothetical protein